jgi:hypothetical protein
MLREIHQEQPGSQLERRSLDFFLSQTSAMLSGYFDSPFSTRVLPQLIYTEPAIRHAVLAVSSFYEQYSAANLSLIGSDCAAHPAQSFALEQYNKAIEHLTSPILSGSRHAMNVILTSCFLFICVEFLRGNREKAITHIRSGLKILNTRAHSPDSSNEVSNPSSTLQLVEDELVQIFVRLNLQLALFGEPMAPIVPRTIMQEPCSASILVDTFSDVLGARSCLDYLLNVVLQFIRTHSNGRYTSAPDISVIVEQLKLDAQLCRWSVALDRLTKASPDHESDGAAIILRVQHRVASIWLNTCLVAEETTFDKFAPDFEYIVSQAEALSEKDHRSGDRKTTSSRFSFDVSIIPSVYFVAIKCRNPSVRRKAASWLARMPRVEGMWNPMIVSKVAVMVMTIEEEKLVNRARFALPSEAARIHNAEIEYRDSHSCLVTCRSKPNGIKGDWHYRQSEIRW